MIPSHPNRAFSLVEVILAIGIFALAIVSIIGLLGPINAQVRKMQDAKVAHSLPTPIRTELNRMKFTSFVNPGLTAAASAWQGDVVNPNTDRPTNAANNRRVLASLVATMDGSRVVNVGQSETLIPPDDQYFLVQILEPDSPTSGAGTANLNYQQDDAHMALEVEISWPFRLPGGAEAPYSARDKFSYFTAIIAGEPF